MMLLKGILLLLFTIISPVFGGGVVGVCDNSCTFVLKNESGSSYVVINDPRAKLRLSPFSTFKVVNTLIATEVGVVDNLHQPHGFDQQKYPVQKWWPSIWYEKPLSIRAAFQKSAVPIFQGIANKIGVSRMRSFIKQLQYGNMDISSGIDTFWLDGSLAISAKEQVDFLQKVFTQNSPISNESMSLLKEVMLIEDHEDYKLYAKTGAGPTQSGGYLGWYIGVIETKSDVYYFALNVSDESLVRVKQRRRGITVLQLEKYGLSGS